MMNMNMMNDPSLAGMIPFDPMQFYEPPRPRYIFKMPRVVPNQKDKFENDDLFKRLYRDGEVRYTGFRDRPQEERQLRFQTGCREGHTEISFVASGTNVQLIFNSGFHHHHHHPAYIMERECDFDKEIGKVSGSASNE
jgi:Core binding factor beta subunit